MDDPFAPLSAHYDYDEPEQGCKCRACYLLMMRPVSIQWDLDEAVAKCDFTEAPKSPDSP